ncbi:MAG: hybrid sensor histidine kinase/response regulator [Desulfobacteraceae bacterium]|jgi:signal transduction histidine kinase
MEKKTVLMVDDEVHILNSIRRVLHKEDYQLLTASSAMEALDIMRENHINVVLTDLGMSGMNGMALLAEIKRLYPETIRLVISGSYDSTTILNAINGGNIYRYITKPWNDMELKILIQQALDVQHLNEEKKQLLHTLKDQNQQLEKRVDEQARQLMDSMGMAIIGKYTAQIVHNLNNTLNGLSGIFFLMTEELSEPVPDRNELAGYCNDGILCTEQMHGIILDILNRARNKNQFKTEEIDINTLIREEDRFFCFDHTYRHSIKRKLVLQEDLPALTGNSSQIKQILDNLIKNAIDAMENSLIKELILETSFKDGQIILRVKDTGEGIDTDVLTRIFDSEFTTKPIGKGTGLGLASVKSMVEAYGGTIHVASEKGAGSTFTLNIPIADVAHSH